MKESDGTVASVKVWQNRNVDVSTAGGASEAKGRKPLPELGWAASSHWRKCTNRGSRAAVPGRGGRLVAESARRRQMHQAAEYHRSSTSDRQSVQRRIVQGRASGLACDPKSKGLGFWEEMGNVKRRDVWIAEEKEGKCVHGGGRTASEATPAAPKPAQANASIHQRPLPKSHRSVAKIRFEAPRKPTGRIGMRLSPSAARCKGHCNLGPRKCK
jgi:hypothetical protein